MKSSITQKGVLIGLLMFVATSAFAVKKGTLSVSSPFNVAGKRLAAGEYSVRWDGEGPSVDLKFVKDGKEVAETPAVVVTLKNPSSYDAVVLAKDADGSRRLKQVCFSGKRLVLEIGAPPEGVPPYICD